MDWTQLLNQMIDILLPILATFLTGFFTYLGAKLKMAYEQKVNTETAQKVVQDVVKFVQQVYGDLEGKEKLQKAIEQASAILASKGITITEAEINMLIEAAVYGLKEGTQTIVFQDTGLELLEEPKQEECETVVKESEGTD